MSYVHDCIEHGASMMGEFFSGGVCQKENGENCSSESMVDGRLTRACTCGGDCGIGSMGSFGCIRFFVVVVTVFMSCM